MDKLYVWLVQQMELGVLPKEDYGMKTLPGSNHLPTVPQNLVMLKRDINSLNR
jgi:hypothetical protein